MSDVLDAVDRFFEWLANYLGWFDGAELANNLLADAIFALTVGGAILAYLRWRRWQPARRALLTNLKSVAENCIWMWDRAVNPDSPMNLIWSPQLFQELSSKLQVELQNMESVPDDERFELHSAQYWRDLTKSLSMVQEELKRSVDRAQLTLGKEPSAVPAANDLERWVGNLAKFDTFLRYLENQPQSVDVQARYDQQLKLASTNALKVLNSAFDLWKALPDIPGRAG